MRNAVSKIDNRLIYYIFLLSFVGFYAILMVAITVGLGGATRFVTVPARLLICACILLLFVRNLKNLNKVSGLNWFIFFSMLYFTRMFIDYINNKHYYIPISEVFLYFVSFGFLPFITIATQVLNEQKIRAVFKGIYIGGLFFSILTLVNYGRFLGSVKRLNTQTAGEDVMSPLALSYSSALIIGVFIFYLMHNKVNKLQRIFLIGGIALSVIPYILGSSRGSLIAIMIPFFLYAMSVKSLAFRIKAIFLGILFIVGMVFLDSYFESGLLDRFLGISRAIDKGADSAVRIDIWKQGLTQFADFPLFGDKLEVEGYNAYAHNLFVEVLHSMGIIGFIPFAILIVTAWRIVMDILRSNKEYYWIAVIFIQAFFMNMFSGGLHNATRMWTSMALLFALSYYLKNKLRVKEQDIKTNTNLI